MKCTMMMKITTLNLRMPPPHPMMPMAALYGMPGHPYGPAMSMPGKIKDKIQTVLMVLHLPRRILSASVGDIRSHYSASSSVRG